MESNTRIILLSISSFVSRSIPTRYQHDLPRALREEQIRRTGGGSASPWLVSSRRRPRPGQPRESLRARLLTPRGGLRPRRHVNAARQLASSRRGNARDHGLPSRNGMEAVADATHRGGRRARTSVTPAPAGYPRPARPHTALPPCPRLHHVLGFDAASWPSASRCTARRRPRHRAAAAAVLAHGARPRWDPRTASHPGLSSLAVPPTRTSAAGAPLAVGEASLRWHGRRQLGGRACTGHGRIGDRFV